MSFRVIVVASILLLCEVVGLDAFSGFWRALRFWPVLQERGGCIEEVAPAPAVVGRGGVRDKSMVRAAQWPARYSFDGPPVIFQNECGPRLLVYSRLLEFSGIFPAVAPPTVTLEPSFYLSPPGMTRHIRFCLRFFFGSLCKEWMGLVLEEAAQGKLRETPEGAGRSVEPSIFLNGFRSISMADVILGGGYTAL